MQVLVQVLGNDIKNMVVYQDNICLNSPIEELNPKTDLILNRLRWSGMTINEKKYIYNGKRISSLGYSISKEGLMQKILNVSPANSKKELQSFLGLVNFIEDIY